MDQGLLQAILRHPDVFAVIFIALRLAAPPHVPAQLLRISAMI